MLSVSEDAKLPMPVRIAVIIFSWNKIHLIDIRSSTAKAMRKLHVELRDMVMSFKVFILFEICLPLVMEFLLSTEYSS